MPEKPAVPPMTEPPTFGTAPAGTTPAAPPPPPLPFPDPRPSRRPLEFTVHTVESWARAIMAGAVQRTTALSDDNPDVSMEARVFLSRVGDGLGVTVQIEDRLYCVKVGA